MRILWEIGYRDVYNGQHDFPYYLSANWGDSIILPTICALVFQELRPLSGISPHKLAIALFSLAGFIGGACTQFWWVYSDRTELNWTFDGEGYFNLAGWYHAAFLVFVCTLLSGGLGTLILVGRRRVHWERDSIIRHLTIGYLLVLFACLLATDNHRSALGFSDTEASNIVQILALPLISTVLTCVISAYLGAAKRLTITYSITLFTTSVSIPIAILARGTSPTSVTELIGCAGAALFAINFVTAPASTSLFEQYSRSIPVTIIAMVVALLLPGSPQTQSWRSLGIIALCALVAIWLASIAPCLFDSPLGEGLNTAMAGFLLVVLTVIVSAVGKDSNLAEDFLSFVFPLVIVLVSAQWVKSNFRVVTARELAVTSRSGGVLEISRGDRDSLSKQRFLRYKVLVGFLFQAVFAMMFNTWVHLESFKNSYWATSWRIIFCLLLLSVMAIVSFVFSWLSVHNNIYAMRGINLDFRAYRRTLLSASLVSSISLVYGVSLFVLSSTRSSLLIWLLMLAIYLIIMFGACMISVSGVVDVRNKTWPCVSSPWAAIRQDILLSLTLFNTLGLGIPIWISDRFLMPLDMLSVLAGILVPISAVFLFFLHNNVSHVRKQEREVRAVIASDPHVDSIRAEEYLNVLRRHCMYQNRIMLAAAFMALSVFFIIRIIAETLGLQSSEGSLGFKRLIGGEDWAVLPDLADVVKDD